MELDKRVGILVSLMNETTDRILGVGMDINAVYAIVGFWMEDNEELNDALESMLNKTPRPGKDEKWVNVYCKRTAIGQYTFSQIPVTEEILDDQNPLATVLEILYLGYRK